MYALKLPCHTSSIYDILKYIAFFGHFFHINYSLVNLPWFFHFYINKNEIYKIGRDEQWDVGGMLQDGSHVGNSYHV